jgi:hypothetical protein
MPTEHVPSDDVKEHIRLDLLPTDEDVYDNILTGYDLPQTIS